MKLNKFFMGIIGALALTSCSNDDVVPNQKPAGVDNDDSRFMKVSIRSANPVTRAEESETESNSNYVDGIPQENKVKNVLFYFFDKDGNAINVVNGDKNYFISEGDAIKDDDGNDTDEKEDLPGEGSNAPNVEKILNATIVLSNGNSQEDNIKNLYSMVAILNYDVAGIEPTANKNLNELKELCDNYAKSLCTTPPTGVIPAPIGYTDNANLPYMVMTSSSYVANEDNGDGTYTPVETIEVKNIATHVKDKEEDAASNPVEMYVERLVAKVTATVNWDDNLVQVQNVKFGDLESCTAILLKDKQNGEPYKVKVKVEDEETGTVKEVEKDIYVIFEGWNLHGTAQESWLFKRVNKDWNLDNWGDGGDGKAWNNPSYFRSHWAWNPTGVKSTTLGHFPYEMAEGKIGETFYYCLENAADNYNDGTKSSYDPDKAISPRTQAFFKAKLVTLSDDKKVADVLSLAEWGGYKYEQDDVITAMMGSLNNDVFIRSKVNEVEGADGTTTINYRYVSLSDLAETDMITLVSGLESGDANITSDKENDKRYLSYLQLKKEFEFPNGYDHAFFRNMNGDRYVSLDKDASEEQKEAALEEEIKLVNEKLHSVIGAKVWEGGKTYYYTDLRHLGTNENKGLYGVVRNHLYQVELNSVFGLGTPVLDPSTGPGQEIIIPQKPGKDAFFLGARVNILSWRIVKNDVDLEW